MRRKLIRDLLAYLPSKVLPALTAFITVPIFTRLFTPAEFGNYVLAFGVAQLMVSALYSGYGAGTIRYYSAYEIKNQLATYFTNLFTSIVFVTLFGALIGTVGLLLLRPVIDADLLPLLWLAILVFVATAWFHTLTLVIRAQEHSFLYTVFELGYRYGVVAASLVLVLLFRMNVAGLMWGEILVLVALAAIMWWRLRDQISLRWQYVSRPELTKLWRFAWPLTLGNFAMWGIRLSDRYVIEAFRNTAEVGLYSVSYNISSRTIDLLVNLVMLVPAPVIMRVWEEQGSEDTEEYLSESVRMFFILLVPAVVGISIIARPTVYLLADPAYLDGYRAVWLVALASLFWGLSQLGSFGMLVTNRTRQLARNQFIGLVAGLTINLFLVPRYGFMGAATGGCISMGLLALLQIRSSAPMLAWHWPLATLMRVAVASAGMGAAAQFVLISLGEPSGTLERLGVIAATVATGGVVYAIGLLLIGEVSLRDVTRLFNASTGTNTETRTESI